MEDPAALSTQQAEFFLSLCRSGDPPWRKNYFSRGPDYTLNYELSSPAEQPYLRRRSLCQSSVTKAPRVSIDFVRTSFQKVPVRFMEDNSYVIVVLPEFRAEASVAVKPADLDGSGSAASDEWQLGWICAASRHDVRISYEGEGDGGRRVRGVASWELPALHLNTTDLTCRPWLNYDACTPTFKLSSDSNEFQGFDPLLDEVGGQKAGGGGGGSSGRRQLVQMRCFDDRFMPPVPWKLSCHHSAFYATAATFDLEYYAWLTLKNVSSDAYFVLRTLVWTRQLSIDLCCLNPVGSRAFVVSPLTDKMVDVRHNFPLPEWTVVGPTAKGELTLLYHVAREHETAVPYIVVEGKNFRYPNLPRM